MLTYEELQIFKKYNGDIDVFSRCATHAEKKILTDSDFQLITDLTSKIYLVKNGLANAEFAKKLEERLKKYCAKSNVIRTLYELSH